MKVVLAVDAIFPPLTGIGRYALELARGLAVDDSISDLRLYALGRWLKSLPAHEPALHSVGASPGLARIRRWAAAQPAIVWAFGQFMPALHRASLVGCRDYLYHSPNYFLPPGTGPAVTTVHDLSILRFPEHHPRARVQYFMREMPKSLQRAQHVITDAESVRQEVMEVYAWPASHITAVPLGVDPVFHPRPAEALLPELKPFGFTPGAYSLCVSTVEPRKRVDRLIEAYARLPASLRQAYPLVIAGGRGWLSEDLHRRMDRATAEGWLCYLSYVPERSLPGLYAGARSFFFPSVYEGFGLPVLESMASGVPVVTSDCSCLPEVSAGAAKLVDADDVPAFSEAIRLSLEDEPWRAWAVQRGLEVAASRSWAACLQATLDVYRKLV